MWSHCLLYMCIAMEWSRCLLCVQRCSLKSLFVCAEVYGSGVFGCVHTVWGLLFFVCYLFVTITCGCYIFDFFCGFYKIAKISTRGYFYHQRPKQALYGVCTCNHQLLSNLSSRYIHIPFVVSAFSLVVFQAVLSQESEV